MNFLDIAAELAAARKAWATDFLMYRAVHADTDNKARTMADERNVERLVMAEARYELAKWRLNHADPGPSFGADHQSTEAPADTDADGPDCGD